MTEWSSGHDRDVFGDGCDRSAGFPAGPIGFNGSAHHPSHEQDGQDGHPLMIEMGGTPCRRPRIGPGGCGPTSHQSASMEGRVTRGRRDTVSESNLAAGLAEFVLQVHTTDLPSGVWTAFNPVHPVQTVTRGATVVR